MANGDENNSFNRKKDQTKVVRMRPLVVRDQSDLYALALKACGSPGATDAIGRQKLWGIPLRSTPPTGFINFDRVSRRGRISGQTSGTR